MMIFMRPTLATKLTCKKCGHQWLPRVVAVIACPKCKNVKWDDGPKRKPVSK